MGEGLQYSGFIRVPENLERLEALKILFTQAIKFSELVF